MNISPINNLSFQSKLPPAKITKGGHTQDYWLEFANLVKTNKNEFTLRHLLERVSNEGEHNILALESTDSSKPFVDYHFRYYDRFKDLENDRINNPHHGERNIGKSISIRENKIDNKVYQINTKTGEITQRFHNLFEALSKSLQEMLKPEKPLEIKRMTSSELLESYRSK